MSETTHPLRWYVVQTQPGFEKKVEQQIKESAAKKGLIGQIDEVMVPSEPIIEVRRGQKVQVDQKFFPGYVLVKMAMTDEAWHLIRQTPKVAGFLGSSRNRPSPITEAEVARIIKQTEQGSERPRPATQFEIGEQVRVSEGPFMSFNGTVEDVDERSGRLKVTVSIFGRATPVDLEYAQVERV